MYGNQYQQAPSFEQNMGVPPGYGPDGGIQAPPPGFYPNGGMQGPPPDYNQNIGPQGGALWMNNPPPPQYPGVYPNQNNFNNPNPNPNKVIVINNTTGG